MTVDAANASDANPLGVMLRSAVPVASDTADAASRMAVVMSAVHVDVADADDAH